MVFKEITINKINIEIMDLQAKLLEITRANTAKGANKSRSINTLIVEVLGQGAEMDRTELVSHIAKIRYEDTFSPLTEESLEDPKVLEEFIKVTKTVKNGVDTSISHSNNNSSFHYNEDFKEWNLLEKAGKYRLEKVVVEEIPPVEEPKVEDKSKK